MRKVYALMLLLAIAVQAQSQGWPANYSGVMLQGFYWIEEPADATQDQKDSIANEFKSLKWTSITKQADELSEFFSLIWVPQSGKTSSNPSMGYDPTYWFNQNGTFGTPSELRTMTKTLKEKGTGVIADVVINHRMSISGWLGFPEEKYAGKSYTYVMNGETYQILPEDICANDDGGTTAQWAASNGYTLSSTNDEGEDFSGGRDLDHTSANVQRCVKAYLDYLLNNLGYSGFRLDMVKGYSPYYTGLYNSAVNTTFSVGEYWDSNDNIKNWMDGTRVNGEVQSGAFDFQLKWQLNDACYNSDWGKLYPSENTCLSWNSYWPRYAVTFVDNHDTYRDYRCSGNVAAANAYILSMPGTPCVFMQHWKQYKQQIKQLIYARQMAGVTNQSGFEVKHSDSQCLSIRVNGNLEVLMGNGYGVYDASEGTDMTLVTSGENYAVYLSKSLNTPWVSLPSGEYEGPVGITITALSNNSSKLVYTLDGTTPTANSTQIESGSSILLNEDATLTVGVLVGSQVVNIIKRNYTVASGEEQHTVINVYAPQGAPYLYAWNAAGEPINGAWPGQKMTETTTTDNGTQWYTVSFTELGNVNIIFNNGEGQQTANIEDVAQGTHYFTYNGTAGYKEVTEDYVPTEEQPTIVTVNVAAAEAPYLYAWDEDGATLCGSWPGTKLSKTTTFNGQSFYTQQLTTTAASLNIIFNNGSGGQTADISELTTGIYYFTYDGTSGYDILQSVATAIRDVANSKSSPAVIYNLQGQRINKLQRGVNIVNGQKVIGR